MTPQRRRRLRNRGAGGAVFCGMRRIELFLVLLLVAALPLLLVFVALPVLLTACGGGKY